MKLRSQSSNHKRNKSVNNVEPKPDQCEEYDIYQVNILNECPEPEYDSVSQTTDVVVKSQTTNVVVNTQEPPSPDSETDNTNMSVHRHLRPVYTVGRRSDVESDTNSGIVIDEIDCSKFPPENVDPKNDFCLTPNPLPSPRDPYIIKLKVENEYIDFLIDTGSELTLIPAIVYTEKLSHVKLEHRNLTLKAYNGSLVDVKGVGRFSVKYNNIETSFEITIVEHGSRPLLGRDFLSENRINWHNIIPLDRRKSVDEIQQDFVIDEKFMPLFETEEFHPIRGYTSKLCVDSSIKPLKFRSRNLSFAMKPLVMTELARMEAEGVISKCADETELSWISPIVNVKKPNGKLRVCGSYDLTINKAISAGHYNIPDPEEIYSKMNGCKYFSKIDLHQAFWNVPLEKEYRKFTAINTPKGIYVFNVLPYGIASSPGIFNEFVQNHLIAGIENTCGFYDDIIIGTRTKAEHIIRVNEVLQSCLKFGVTLNEKKSLFCKNEIPFLGVILSADGIKPSPDKIKAIKESKPPSNVGELRSFIRFVSFLQRFIPKMGIILRPLYDLLKKSRTWEWNFEHQKCFENIKNSITSNSLANYDPKSEVCMYTDACKWGVSAILFNVDPDGQLKPIYYASRATTETESRYSQYDL